MPEAPKSLFFSTRIPLNRNLVSYERNICIRLRGQVMEIYSVSFRFFLNLHGNIPSGEKRQWEVKKRETELRQFATHIQGASSSSIVFNKNLVVWWWNGSERVSNLQRCDKRFQNIYQGFYHLYSRNDYDLDLTVKSNHVLYPGMAKVSVFECSMEVIPMATGFTNDGIVQTVSYQPK